MGRRISNRCRDHIRVEKMSWPVLHWGWARGPYGGDVGLDREQDMAPGPAGDESGG